MFDWDYASCQYLYHSGFLKNKAYQPFFFFWNEVISFNEIVTVFKVLFYVIEKWKEWEQEKENDYLRLGFKGLPKEQKKKSIQFGKLASFCRGFSLAFGR